jgi:hypothetical protein
MNRMSDNFADSLTTVSSISAIAHFAIQVQPIISAVAGVVAIVSGTLAAIYYIKKLQKRTP